MKAVSLTIPATMTKDQCTQVINAVCCSEDICTLILLGGRLKSRVAMRAALATLCKHVAQSNLIHLNVGEFPGHDFSPLLKALRHPRCIVGYVFVELDMEPALKKDMILACRANRQKLRHQVQFVRLFAVAQYGAHTWHNPTRRVIDIYGAANTLVILSMDEPLPHDLPTLDGAQGLLRLHDTY
jgi:hypothetical protein